MSDFLVVCERAVREAGQCLLDKMGHVTVREKGQFDLVTDADFAAQEVVRSTVLGKFPDHAILGEEGRAGSEAATYRWIVDPLDGTTNYVHGVPHFSVSLALERRGDLVVGAVFDPIGRECYTAERGGGAWLNGVRIRVSRVTELGGALGAVGFPAVVDDDSPDLTLFLRAMRVCQSLRRTGSAALNLCYVAAGRFDLAWSCSCSAWDVAAGVLLIREAGGVVTAVDGGPLDLDRPVYVAAANGQLHSQFMEVVATGGGGRGSLAR